MAQANSFDFDTFADELIRTIDSIRSIGKGKATSPIESRINAFYRALGLPAILPDKFDGDPKNVGNSFKYSDFASADDIFTSLENREAAFDLEVEDKEVIAFLNFKNNISFKYSLGYDENDENQSKRVRGLLHPMVVNGSIDIFPAKNRVESAFVLDNDLEEIDKVKYKRPLIEAIIMIRAKSNGVLNAEELQSVQDDLNIVIPFGPVGGKNDLNDRLDGAIESIRAIFDKRLASLSKGLSETYTAIKAKPGNIPAGKSKNIDVINDADFKSNNNSSYSGTSSEKLKRINDQINLRNSIIALFDFAPGKSGINETILSSSLMSIFATKPLALSKEREDVKRKISKSEKTIRTAQRTLDYLFGEFAGISGVDALAIVVALFALEEKYLYGLLNKEAIQRIIDQKSIINDNTDIAGVEESVTELAKKTSEILGIFDAKLMQENKRANNKSTDKNNLPKAK